MKNITINGVSYKIVDFFSHKKFKRATYYIKEEKTNNVFCISDDEYETFSNQK